MASSASALRKLTVDIHTHVYLPRYAALLRARTAAPRILARTSPGGKREERLLILDDEPSGGRPVGAQYWDREEKLRFMDKHGIDISVVSSANPWLDFLPTADAQTLARELNDDLEAYCASSPLLSPSPSTPTAEPPRRRLYGFALLPLVPATPLPALLAAVAHIASLPHLRGVIVGTRGLGAGLDDAALDPLWAALADAGLVVFVHPHYGVDARAWGGRENGHVLPLALGFPFETTVAITRLILAGVLDRHPRLRLLLAHAGGALPLLSSRLASCVAHDPLVARRLRHDARFYLGRLYYDAVAYGPEELGLVADVVGRAAGFRSGGAANVGGDGGEDGDADAASGLMGRAAGSARMLFGTDHPFFPPLDDPGAAWPSVTENVRAVRAVEGWDAGAQAGVLGGNAVRLFGL